MKRAIIFTILFIFLIIVVTIFREKPKKIIRPIIPAVTIKGEIAIVIDDWGYSLNNLSAIEKIKYPLNVSILPNLKYSQEIASKLHSEGFEIMLHLPMQPLEKLPLEKNTISSSMSRDKIIKVIADDLTNLTYARGVNNHMGSKATGDLRIMEAVFKELKKRNLYFLDSFVNPASVCIELSHKFNYKIFKRDVFLDNVASREYILGQINRLKSKAKSSGFAIGIGHDRKLTLEVLKEAMPQLAKEGYRFVYLSEMAK
ncbi:MAG: divergent polysaccharide deacetylase family protein [Candidatus Omnitrophica bacterium]|nr:divergent polysaccharide deacetylase family protein [Candidatus Omnitrophota bacterium]